VSPRYRKGVCGLYFHVAEKDLGREGGREGGGGESEVWEEGRKT